jgi:hypothetical protein
MGRISQAVLGLAFVATPLCAQRSALREVHEEPRGQFGASFVAAEPLGEFRRNNDFAAGLSVFGVTSGGALALRVEAGWMTYDARYQNYGVSTLSQIGTLSAGPQLTLGSGSFRVYGFATIGGSAFWSTASYQGCGCYGKDWYLNGHTTMTTSAGAGVQLALSTGRTPIMLDVAARGQRHDRVEYVPANGLTQNPDGSFTERQVKGPVDMRVYQVGVSIGIR